MGRLEGFEPQHREVNSGRDRTSNAQTPDAPRASIYLPVAGTCSLVSPDLGALVPCLEAVLCARSLLHVCPFPQHTISIIHPGDEAFSRTQLAG